MPQSAPGPWILLLGLVFPLGCGPSPVRPPNPATVIEVAPDGAGFRFSPGGAPFIPWGFNYDHDDSGRLLEDYWNSEWPRIEKDFREMKRMGATVVRVHLQLCRFLRSPSDPDLRSIAQLGRLLSLAEEVGLYLDLTGLGCYRKSDVPPWYDQAPEKERWAIQARFWEAVAQVGAGSPAVFCYNLMNEPVSPAGPAPDWHSGSFGGFYYVESLSKDPAGRSRNQVAQEWMDTQIRAVRKRDGRHLITVGLFFIFEVRGGLSLGSEAEELGRNLDFLSVHLYPKEGKIPDTLKLLGTLALGKPIVIEETGPLNCSLPSFKQFLRSSRAHASGWIGFFWGKTIEDCRSSKDLKDAFMAGWLEFFLEEGPAFRSGLK